MTEAQVELATEDVVVQRVRDLYLDVVLLSEQGVHLPDVQVARQILAALCPSSDVVAGAASERRDVCNDGSSLLGVLDNVSRPTTFRAPPPPVLRPRAGVFDEVLGDAHRSVSTDTCEQDINNITKNIKLTTGEKSYSQF